MYSIRAKSVFMNERIISLHIIILAYHRFFSIVGEMSKFELVRTNNFSSTHIINSIDGLAYFHMFQIAPVGLRTWKIQKYSIHVFLQSWLVAELELLVLVVVGVGSFCSLFALHCRTTIGNSSFLPRQVKKY